MLHQHGGGHAAHAAGNGGDGVHNGLHLVKLRIAGNTAQTALGVGLVGIPVDGNLNDHLAGTDIVLGQRVQHTGSGYNDVRVSADFRGIHGLGMADGNGGILTHEHHGGGLAYNQAAADDNGVFTLAVDAVVIQDFHTGGGGAGSVAQGK